MRFFCILFVISFWLVGCASYMSVSVSDGAGDYSIYRNGELVCSASDACTIENTAESEMYLEAKKDDVVYGAAYVHRKKKEIDHSHDDERDWWTGKTKKEEREELEAGNRELAVLFALVFPVFLICVDFGAYPNAVVIPVKEPNSAEANYPWSLPMEKANLAR